MPHFHFFSTFRIWSCWTARTYISVPLSLLSIQSDNGSQTELISLASISQAVPKWNLWWVVALWIFFHLLCYYYQIWIQCKFFSRQTTICLIQDKATFALEESRRKSFNPLARIRLSRTRPILWATPTGGQHYLYEGYVYTYVFVGIRISIHHRNCRHGTVLSGRHWGITLKNTFLLYSTLLDIVEWGCFCVLSTFTTPKHLALIGISSVGFYAYMELFNNETSTLVHRYDKS